MIFLKTKITSILLAFSMFASSIAAGSFAANAIVSNNTDVSAASTTAASTSTTAVSESTGPQKKIQGSAVLHCFNWSYNSIRANLQSIKDAGYTAVQTSPVQPPKDYSSSWTDVDGQWWKLYQPISISIANGNSWLGTKAQLKSLCDAAENLGMKVIVDIVANHMANVSESGGNQMSNIYYQVDSNLRNNSNYWHINWDWANDDGNRYTMTVGSIGMPDLNTGNSYIQDAYKNLLIDCINQGVDGFRFDAAKHIELPTDSGNSSQFWPTVINGSQSSTSNEIYYYGEILNGCATSISNYTKYMSVTDNYSSDLALVCANNGDAAGLANPNYSKGAGANKTVLWAESHDTYMGDDAGSAGIKNTSGISDDTIIKTWAMVGSRADATSLFLVRPADKMGNPSSNTTWKSKAVTEVNKFKNYFDGQSEYLASSGSIAYNERGTEGVVLINCSGKSTSVNVPAHKMSAGTYTDKITGTQFKVENGQITGLIGDTGVAVVYNEKEPDPSASITPDSTNYKTDTLTLTLKYENATSGQYSINNGSYTTYTNGQTITIGSGLPYGTTTTVQVKASNGSTTSSPVSYKYTKVDPSATQKVYFDNSSYGWSNVYAYIYNGSTQNAAWPGQKMTLDTATGYYVLEVPNNLSNGYAMFTESYSATTHRYPADGEDGLPLNGKSMIMRSNHQWNEYTDSDFTIPTATESSTYTVSFTNSNYWSGTISCYYWKDGSTGPVAWPGKSMTYSTVNDYGQTVYTIEVPKTIDRLIFTNGSSQTVDIPFDGTYLRYYALTTTDSQGHYECGTW